MQTTLPFFLRTLNLEPDFKPAPVNGGNSNMLLEHYNKAIGYYAKAVEFGPAMGTRLALPGPWTARTRPARPCSTDCKQHRRTRNGAWR